MAGLTGKADQAGADEPSVVARVGVGQRYYVLIVLMLVSTVSILDRNIMSILIEPIKRDLFLSDTQIGFLTGIAFAFVYATLGIPFARLADRWSRINIITIALSIWSVMTILCGAAQNATHMFLTRFGVGFGEAGGTAPGQAFVGDIFPRHERATAMAVLTLASPLGIAGGLFLGGWAQEAFGWRTTFLIAGMPGLILAPLVFFTFPRVRKGMADGVKIDVPQSPFLPTLKTLISIRTFPLMAVAVTTQSFLSFGLTVWLPPFLARSHDMSPELIGATLGSALGTGSLLGHIVGGPLADWLGRYDLRWHFWIPTIAAPLSGLCAVVAFTGPTSVALFMLGATVFAAGLFAGPYVATIMNLAPVNARATAVASLLLCINVVGLGLGPQFVGILSDLFRPAYGEESLRVALLWATCVVIPSGICFYLASCTYRADIEAADLRNQQAVAE